MENQSVYAVFDDCRTLEDTKLFFHYNNTKKCFDNHGEMVMAESPFEREEYNCCGANCLYVEWDGVCFTNRQTV